MLALGGQARILLYREPVDFRKGFEGLSALVEQNLNDEITSGTFFVFVNRTRNRMKILYWDTDGLALWYKRLEKGHYSKKQPNKLLLTRREFFMLIEGITPKRLQKRYEHG